MKLYDFELAPNAQRVRVFLAEKGLEVPTQQLNVRDDDQFVEPFTSMNPFHCVPFLELDDGKVIAESMSICRYLEELHPEPPLFGRTAEERAVIDMWLRRFELDAFIPMLHAVRNHVPMFAGRVVPGTRTDGDPRQGDDGSLPDPRGAAYGPERIHCWTRFYNSRYHRIFYRTHDQRVGNGPNYVLSRRHRLVCQGLRAAGLPALGDLK